MIIDWGFWFGLPWADYEYQIMSYLVPDFNFRHFFFNFLNEYTYLSLKNGWNRYNKEKRPKFPLRHVFIPEKVHKDGTNINIFQNMFVFYNKEYNYVVTIPGIGLFKEYEFLLST